MLESLTELLKMPATGTEPGAIRFGVFEVDPRSGELRRNGSRVKLQEQPFQILLTLLAKPGEVITREELRVRLWAEDTYVDFDHSLNAAVRRLRDALGDSAENPRFVETVARRGYRFLAPVHANGHAVAISQQAPVVSYRWWIFGAVGMALLIVGVVAGWHVGHANAPPKVLSERRLTANAPENRVTDGVWAADGKSIWALAVAANGPQRLLNVDTSGQIRTVLEENRMKLGWAIPSPDGKHLAIWKAHGGSNVWMLENF
jgi:DNA-binding winged helix-turn-helix (wHTH) protein